MLLETTPEDKENIGIAEEVCPMPRRERQPLFASSLLWNAVPILIPPTLAE
jgi:hypothetical protein